MAGKIATRAAYGEALVELGAYPWPAGPFDPSESLATPAAQLRPAD